MPSRALAEWLGNDAAPTNDNDANGGQKRLNMPSRALAEWLGNDAAPTNDSTNNSSNDANGGQQRLPRHLPEPPPYSPHQPPPADAFNAFWVPTG